MPPARHRPVTSRAPSPIAIPIPPPASALSRRVLLPLVAAALLVALLPGGRWADATALVALGAALAAADARRTAVMALVTGLAVGLSPAGLLLVPCAVGTAIRQRGARHLPIGIAAALAVAVLRGWTVPAAGLPNAVALAAAVPDAAGLLLATGVGVAAWLTARASAIAPAALWREARLGMALLACLLPLPAGVVPFLLVVLAWRLPAAPRLSAANDNGLPLPSLRLAA